MIRADQAQGWHWLMLMALMLWQWRVTSRMLEKVMVGLAQADDPDLGDGGIKTETGMLVPVTCDRV